MVRTIITLFITLVVASFAGAETMNLPRLGRVAVIDPVGSPSGIVILFSDLGATEANPRESSRALTEAGQVVAMVDTGRYLAALDSEGGPCRRASDDLAVLKSQIFQRRHLPANTSAMLAGSNAAGTLAYAVLAQSEAGQFSGAVSFGFDPELPGRYPLCPGAPYAKTAIGFRYLPAEHLNGFWRIATPSPDDEALQPYARKYPELIFPLRDYDDLNSAVISVLADRNHPSQDNSGEGIADLPLVLLPCDRPGKTMAIIYSGDGGWRDLDKQIGGELQKAGVPVVGVDTLRGFWHRQTPEAAAKGLERIIDHFVQAWDAPDVLLIGYSFGADVIPFMVNRLKPSALGHIRLLALLGLSRDTAFEIHVSGWLGRSPASDALALAPELRKLDRSRVQCFYGVEEQDESGCTDDALAGAEIIKTAGGHHFDGDYGKLARKILEGAARRGARLAAAGMPPG
ncbi:MAG: virulence factor family protein [Desulfobacterales bacterium]|nr:virulence factor family protein [Desulfobacterales bacterium]